MRILYTHRIQSRDGQSVHVEEMIAAFRALGHEVRVAAPGFYAGSDFGGENLSVAWLRRLLPGVLGEFAELVYNVPAYRRLRHACMDFQPDLIYERYNLYALAGHWLARATGLPHFVEVNSPLAEERARYGGLRLRAMARAAERRVWRGADCVLAVTEVLRQRILAAGAVSEQVRVVPNGVALERFGFAPRSARSQLTLGFVGFVRDWHGLDTVIRGMAKCSGTKLIVIGDGPARASLEGLAGSLGVANRVFFTGVVAHERVPEAMATFDIALQPRVVEYASPLKIFDYMAAGRAIVAPDQPNIREVLEHGRTALLFNPTRQGAMWDAIARLLKDATLRCDLGAAARAELERRDFTWRGNAERIVALARRRSEPRSPNKPAVGNPGKR